MAFTDLQSFIALLESKGQLIRVKTEVDRFLEITEIADRLVKKDGPAVLFENVKGSPYPLAIGLMGTRERMAWALGAGTLDEVADRIKKLLDVKMGGGLLGMASNLGKLRDLASLPPKRVRSAPVQEVVWRGDEVDLSKLPILHCWPDDGGPFVTFPLVITKDPASGEYNMGMYRMQVMGKNTTGMHWQRHKTGARHLENAQKMGKRLEVAVALGGDPALIYAATAPLPPVPGLNEYAMTGYLRGQNQPVVKGITVDLEVPANAEFILEGYVDPNEAWVDEGPFGDHTGFYTPVDKYPLFHVTAITMRKNPVYPATIVGRPVMEDAYLIEASERIFLTAAQLIVPEIKDYAMPPAGVAHNLVFVAIKKGYPGQAYKVANALFGLGQMMFAKVIVVVDEDVPVSNFDRVWQEVALKAVPGHHTLHGRGPIDVLDHSSRQWSYGGKLIIDATTKHPEEQVTDGFVPRAAAQLPAFEGILDQFQTPDGYWVVKVHKTRAHQGREVGVQLAESEAAAGIRHLLLVDEETEVRDLQDVWWTILNNIDPERDVQVLQDKMVWDGTPKREDEGFHRVWPKKITMPAEVKALVTRRWKEYGLPDL